jgi:hypothetical protein
VQPAKATLQVIHVQDDVHVLCFFFSPPSSTFVCSLVFFSFVLFNATALLQLRGCPALSFVFFFFWLFLCHSLAVVARLFSTIVFFSFMLFAATPRLQLPGCFAPALFFFLSSCSQLQPYCSYKVVLHYSIFFLSCCSQLHQGCSCTKAAAARLFCACRFFFPFQLFTAVPRL